MNNNVAPLTGTAGRSAARATLDTKRQVNGSSDEIR
jgi:hypothetical protein